MEQQTGLNRERSTRLYIVPYLFNLYAEYIMQNTELVNHKLESRLSEVSTTSVQFSRSVVSNSATPGTVAC